MSESINALGATDASIKALGVSDAHGERAEAHTTVYVYEAPVRLWHWINAFSILVLALSGYFIGSPLPSQPGEAYNHFLMGYIRFAHFAAGYILAVGFLLRVYWAFMGNVHARQLFTFPPFWRNEWREGVIHEMKWYAFLVNSPKKYVGHNPLAQMAMFFLFTVMVTFMIVTGFALYSEGEGIDSWQGHMFGWVFNLFPNSQTVHTLHHLGMWAIVTFVIIHIYAAVREDIMSRQSIISSMISGERQFRDDQG